MVKIMVEGVEFPICDMLWMSEKPNSYGYSQTASILRVPLPCSCELPSFFERVEGAGCLTFPSSYGNLEFFLEYQFGCVLPPCSSLFWPILWLCLMFLVPAKTIFYTASSLSFLAANISLSN
ncbi:hypothetical protein O6P43_026994 [Quillaja saponaria]|uniref:Uncharacterized protein n=1 Tax=Quillaja saponaria TaxID=32244 RepID=A0AAD7PCV5_QUISA|nr:hypothetical protein O6P43_026994 [Quillaja saponaria]